MQFTLKKLILDAIRYENIFSNVISYKKGIFVTISSKFTAKHEFPNEK